MLTGTICRSIVPGARSEGLALVTRNLAQHRLKFGAKRRRNVLARQRIGDVGGEEAYLGTAIERAAIEFQPIGRLGLGQANHRVRELDLATRSALLGRQDVKDLRLENVAAGDDEV